jgi:hypothetical protein
MVQTDLAFGIAGLVLRGRRLGKKDHSALKKVEQQGCPDEEPNKDF